MNSTAVNYAPLPPLAKISMIGIWIGAVFYGINCVMYGLCMFVLLRLREKKVPRLRILLPLLSTFLFLLGTANVGTSLYQLLQAFVYAPPDVPNYSTLYWFSIETAPLYVKSTLYIIQLLCDFIILIWRLYVVYEGDWRIIVFPNILVAGYLACSFAAVGTHKRLSGNRMIGLLTANLTMTGCAITVGIHAFVMTAITVRLRKMGQAIADLTGTTANRYTATIYIVIQSGCINLVCASIVFALYATGSPASLGGTEALSQLSAFVPFLIILQVGVMDRQHIPRIDVSDVIRIPQQYSQSQTWIPQEQAVLRSLPLHSIPTHRLSNLSFSRSTDS